MREMSSNFNVFEVAEKLLGLNGDPNDPSLYQSVMAKLLNRSGREMSTRYPLRHPVPLKDKPVSLVAPLKHDKNHNNTSGGGNRQPLEPKSEAECLRQIVLGHLRLFETQQAMVAEKEKEIAELKKENLTLKARLDRMDRRICLTNKPPTAASKQTAMVVWQKNDNNINAAGPSKKRTGADRILSSVSESDEVLVLEPKRKKTRTKSNSVGSEQSREETKSPDDTKIEICQDHCGGSEIPLKHEEVTVPSWRIKPLTPFYSIEITELLSNETFEKRHQKCEVEEKRIKKWDAQRLREEERRRQSLVNNRFSISNFTSWPVKGDESGRNTPMANTFDPKNIEAIEVVDRLPRPVGPSQSKGKSHRRKQ